MTTAAATASETSPYDEPGRSDLAASHPASLELVGEAGEDREARVEGGVFRDAFIGAVIGVLICVPAWMGLVALALRDAGTALLPPVAMAGGVGVIAGVFMGGWAGTLVGASKLEHYEHETRPKAPGAATS